MEIAYALFIGLGLFLVLMLLVWNQQEPFVKQSEGSLGWCSRQDSTAMQQIISQGRSDLARIATAIPDPKLRGRAIKKARTLSINKHCPFTDLHAVAVSTSKRNIKICVDPAAKYQSFFYVLLHEFTHCVLKHEYGHTKKFWQTFNELQGYAVALGILAHKGPPEEEYCGTPIA